MTARVVAFVHAKGTSDRVTNKNLRHLGDRPLFAHALSIAHAASTVDEVVIDSDSDEILRIGVSLGATALKRPAALASNAATGDDLALWQARSRPEAEIVVQVIPTAPFLRPSSVDRAVALLAEPGVHSVAGVASDTLYLWSEGRPAYLTSDGRLPNSTELPPTVWETTGLYANRASVVRETGRRLDVAHCRGLLLSKLEAVDINTPEDFAFAEWLWRGSHPGVPIGPAAAAW